MEREDIEVAGLIGDADLGQVFAVVVSAATLAGAVAGMVDQDASHGDGGRGQEVGAIPFRWILIVALHAHPGFMNQGRGLQAVPEALPVHVSIGDAAQLPVEKGQQIFDGGTHA